MQLWLITLLSSLIARRGSVFRMTAPSSVGFRWSVLGVGAWLPMSVVGLIVVLFVVFFVFWLQIAIEPFALLHHNVFSHCPFQGRPSVAARFCASVRLWRLFGLYLFVVSPSFGYASWLCSVIVAFPGYLHFILSQRTTKPTKWHVRPAKTQISLGIRPA